MMKPTTDEDNNIKECAAEVNLKSRLRTTTLNDKKCADCNKVFKIHFDLVRHVKQYHPNGKAFKCNDCGAHFSNTQALSCHKRVVNNIKQNHVCKFCSKSFIWESHLKRHLSVHNQKCPYSCQFCKQKFKNKDDSKKHQEICAKSKHSCTFCEKSYKHDRGLRKHLVLHTGEKPHFFCSICEKSFTRKDIFKKHQEIHTKYKPNACNKDSLGKHHICKFCSKTFDFESLLKYHLRVHTGERPYSCSVCNRTYVRQKDLNKHQKKGHKQKSKLKDLTCKYCSKTFDGSFHLESHLKLHTDKSAFSCYLCGDVFKQKYSLKNHLNDHLKRESKACDENSKTAGDKQNLNNLQKSDIIKERKEGYKDYQDTKITPKRILNKPQLKHESNDFNIDKDEIKHACVFCSKTFKRSLLLKLHLKEHTKRNVTLKTHPENNFEEQPNCKKELKTKNVCEYCSRTFRRNSYLEIHLRIHTEKRLFPCSMCKKSFNDKSTLKKHQEIHTKHKPQEFFKDLKIFKENEAEEKFIKTLNNLTSVKYLKNNSYQNTQETKNLESIHNIPNELSLDSDDLEIERDMESLQIYNSPIVDKHPSSSINLCTNITQPTKQIVKKCNIAFKPQLYRSLNRFFKVQNTSEQRNYPCFLCEKSYTESRLLKEHQKIHLKQKSKNIAKTLKIPQIVKNPINSVKPFNIKEEPFPDGDHRPDSMEPNSVLKTIKTEFVDESPYNSNESEYHQQNPIASNDSNDLKCQFCYKIFLSGEHLKNHIKEHFGDRFFSCSLCERFYTNKIDLNKHKKVHLKI